MSTQNPGLAMYREARERGVYGPCAIVAYAMLTDTDFETSHYILEEYAGKLPCGKWDPQHPRGGWLGVRDAFRGMGYGISETWFESKTVVTLQRELAERGGKYLVAVSRGAHALAIIDGQCFDWAENRRHRVHKVWEITEA